MSKQPPELLTMRPTVSPPTAAAAAATQSRYERSHLVLRLAIGLLGSALPFLLVLVDGYVLDGRPFPRSSLSAYYYSGVRDVFVGVLSAIGIFLFTYKLFERGLANTLTLIAGPAAIVVALFPTGRPAGVRGLTPLQELLGEELVEGIHFAAGATFIVSLAVLSVAFGIEEGRRREWQWPGSGWAAFHWAMAFLILAALAWIAVTEIWDVGPDRRLLVAESVAAVAFGLSWLLKDTELQALFPRSKAIDVKTP